MLIIRLRRIGRKKVPTYRFIISEKAKDTQGDYLEDLGFFNPHVNPPQIEIKEERVKYWLSHGAQASNTVHNILLGKGMVAGKKKKAVKIKKKQKKKGDEQEKEEGGVKKEEAKKPEEAKSAEKEAKTTEKPSSKTEDKKSKDKKKGPHEKT